MSTGIPDDQLEWPGQCNHEDCLSLARLLTGAYWADGQFIAYVTCVAHVAWAVEQLLSSMGPNGAVAITVVEMHAASRASLN